MFKFIFLLVKQLMKQSLLIILIPRCVGLSHKMTMKFACGGEETKYGASPQILKTFTRHRMCANVLKKLFTDTRLK